MNMRRMGRWSCYECDEDNSRLDELHGREKQRRRRAREARLFLQRAAAWAGFEAKWTSLIARGSRMVKLWKVAGLTRAHMKTGPRGPAPLHGTTR